MDSPLPFLSSRAGGPRKLMKISPSRMQNRTGSERRDRPYSGEVETVFLSDPECAWLSEYLGVVSSVFVGAAIACDPG